MELIKKEEKEILIYGEDAIERGKKVANKLARVIEEGKLYTIIKGRKYVHCEGWTTLGAMLGLFVRIIKMEEVEKDEEFEVKVFAEVWHKNQLISSAYASCSSKEENWKNRDKYAIRSMAQTRATSKVMRLSLSWIMKLAGYEPTPAEEMEIENKQQEQKEKEKDELIKKLHIKYNEWGKISNIPLKTEEEKQRFKQMYRRFLREIFQKDTSTNLTIDELKKAIEMVEGMIRYEKSKKGGEKINEKKNDTS